MMKNNLERMMRVDLSFSKEIDEIKNERIIKRVDNIKNKKSDRRITKAIRRHPLWLKIKKDLIINPLLKEMDVNE